jgi:dihydrofolate reductase
MSNVVYVGTSLDGFLADRNGKLDWLESIPNPDNNDFGWGEFMERIDAIVMGRKTFETIMGFGRGWHYPKKVFILSNSLQSVPDELKDKVEIMKGTPAEITDELNRKGYKDLYIDGGNSIQKFLMDDLIDELMINRLPILLGGGVSLFGDLPKHMMFEHISTKILLNAMVFSHYKRKR